MKVILKPIEEMSFKEIKETIELKDEYILELKKRIEDLENKEDEIPKTGVNLTKKDFNKVLTVVNKAVDVRVIFEELGFCERFIIKDDEDNEIVENNQIEEDVETIEEETTQNTKEEKEEPKDVVLEEKQEEQVVGNIIEDIEIEINEDLTPDEAFAMLGEDDE